MYGSFGRFMLCDTYGAGQKGKLIVCIGDLSNHGGEVISHNQEDDALTAADRELVALENALHSCPIDDHGITPITAVTVKSYHNGKLILTELAIAGCGARLAPPNRHVFVE